MWTVDVNVCVSVMQKGCLVFKKHRVRGEMGKECICVRCDGGGG